nr:uncharacterized protein LOC119179369 [Rhipicephalus microplus]
MASTAPSGRVPDPTWPFREEQALCNVTSTAQTQLLNEPGFQGVWEQLVTDIVDRQAWKVESFDSLATLDGYCEDVRHYPVENERIRMNQRRDAALRLRSNPGRWSRIALDALRELAVDSLGPAVAILAQSGFLAAFEDFAVHTRYFQVTRNLMESAGITVFVSGHASSSIHDVDKLDPIMLAGYSERWEDGKDTSLWRACLESHYSLNPHHQQHELWHADDSDDKCVCTPGKERFKLKERSSWREECWKALPELLCDKSSRRLQKELDGVVSREMWTVQSQFYSGMPDVWLERATKMAAQLAESTPSAHSNVTVAT